jgi:cytidylate kinase
MHEHVPIVVTISRQLASGGAYVGQRLARRLGIRYVDREILKEAAAMLGVEDERTVEPFEERVCGLWDRVARSMAIGTPDAPFIPPPPPTFDEGDLLGAEKRIITNIAQRTSAVIVGRGAAHILKGRTGLIRVFVHAPQPHRIAEAQRVYALDVAAAREMVERSDRERARFVQSLTGRVWTDACLYDLAFDTSVFPADLVVDLLARVINERRNVPALPSDAASRRPAGQ